MASSHQSPKAGKTLLYNWNEERTVAPVDVPDQPNILKGRSHRGILAQNGDTSFSNATEVRDNYKGQPARYIPEKGPRQMMLERALYAEAQAEVAEEMSVPFESPDYRSVTSKDFAADGFVSKPPPASRPHDYASEQPVTFWTENARTMHGVTQIKTRDTPFRRNAAFSTPVDQRFDNIEPYQIESYPKM